MHQKSHFEYENDMFSNLLSLHNFPRCMPREDPRVTFKQTCICLHRLHAVKIALDISRFSVKKA